MGRIEFWPLCSKCGHVLKSELINFVADVHTVDVPGGDGSNEKIDAILYELTPSKCPYCGEVFESVAMPELPFDPKEHGNYIYRWSNGKFGRRYRSKNRLKGA